MLADVESHEIGSVVLLQTGGHLLLLESLSVVELHLYGAVACLSHPTESIKVYMGAWQSSKSRLVSSQSALCCG